MDHSGTLDLDELVRVFTDLGCTSVSKAAIKELTKEFDTNNDGLIDEDEFEQLFVALDSLVQTFLEFKHSGKKNRARTIFALTYFGCNFVIFCISISLYSNSFVSERLPTDSDKHWAEVGRLGSILSGVAILLGFFVAVMLPVLNIKTLALRGWFNDFILLQMEKFGKKESYAVPEKVCCPTKDRPVEPPQFFSYRQFSKAQQKKERLVSVQREKRPSATSSAPYRL